MLCEELERLEGEFDEIVVALEDPDLTDEERASSGEGVFPPQPHHQGSSGGWSPGRLPVSRNRVSQLAIQRH